MIPAKVRTCGLPQRKCLENRMGGSSKGPLGLICDTSLFIWRWCVRVSLRQLNTDFSQERKKQGEQENKKAARREETSRQTQFPSVCPLILPSCHSYLSAPPLCWDMGTLPQDTQAQIGCLGAPDALEVLPPGKVSRRFWEGHRSSSG